MVVRVMKWLSWPPIQSRKFQVNLTIHSLEGCLPPTEAASGELDGLLVDVKWKGPKSSFGSRFRRSCLKRARTAEKTHGENGIVTWEEALDYECVLVEANNNSFQPWDVHFVIVRAVHQGPKTKLSVIGTASMNIAEFVSSDAEARQPTKINVQRPSGAGAEAALCVTVSFVELRANQEGSDFVHRVGVPTVPCISGPYDDEKDAPHRLAEGLSGRTTKNAKRPAAVVDGKISQEFYVLERGKFSSSSSSEESSHGFGALFESDSVDECDDDRLEDVEDSSIRKSFSYGTLAGVNLVVEGALPSFREGESPTQHVISLLGRTFAEDMPKLIEETSTSDTEQVVLQPSTRSFLPWKKRKLSFRSPRARGEPLLNKSYGDDGGDDIDHDRRQACTPTEQLSSLCCKTENNEAPLTIGCLDFGEEGFSVGCWEKKEVVSRDGRMKLTANAFFASIDQRNERAAGESACTALVAVLADWLHQNPNRMPIRTEFDTLIREGSAEWRQLCEVEAYRDRFPDGHFDLDTVLQAKIRPLTVASGRSFVGFFQPEGVGGSFDFLQGAMLFENIWDGILEETSGSKSRECFEPAIYIVSWNDHFFILKVDHDAYYIIDTLGERLYEGCSEAYIIRFDKETRLSLISDYGKEGEENVGQPRSLVALSESATVFAVTGSALEQTRTGQELCTHPEQGCGNGRDRDTLKTTGKEIVYERNGRDKDTLKTTVKEAVYEGKEACREFIKGFFAAVPLRELQIDLKKGLLGKFPLHHRLQIEFHFTSLKVEP